MAETYINSPDWAKGGTIGPDTLYDEPKGFYPLSKLAYMYLTGNPVDRTSFQDLAMGASGQLQPADRVSRTLLDMAKHITPKRIWNFVSKHPEPTIIQQALQADLKSTADYTPKNWGRGKNTATIRLTRPSITDTLHEIVHDASYKAGVGTQAPPGIGATEQYTKHLEDYYRKRGDYTGFGDLAAGEHLPQAVEGFSKSTLPADYETLQAALKWLSDKFGKSPIEIQRSRAAMKSTMPR